MFEVFNGTVSLRDTVMDLKGVVYLVVGCHLDETGDLVVLVVEKHTEGYVMVSKGPSELTKI